MNEMNNELTKTKSIMREGIDSLDFWKMILTVGVFNSVNDEYGEPSGEPSIEPSVELII